ncbi:MAG: hypothetical protein AB2A00_25350 [Myxococcota bacterium]
MRGAWCVMLVLLGVAGCVAGEEGYACGPFTCERGEQYCEKIPALGLAAYNCRELPDACKGASDTCRCLSAKACGDLCEDPEGPDTAVVTCDDQQP